MGDDMGEHTVAVCAIYLGVREECDGASVWHQVQGRRALAMGG